MKMFYIWITMRCYFAFLSIDIHVQCICVLHSIFFDIFVSAIIYFIHQIVLLYKNNMPILICCMPALSDNVISHCLKMVTVSL